MINTFQLFALPKRSLLATEYYIYYFCSQHFSSAESVLIDELLQRYTPNRKYARPVLNSSLPMDVEFELILLQITDFDEKNQKISTLVWKKMVGQNK